MARLQAKLPAFFRRPVAAAPRIVRALSRSHQHYIAKSSNEPNFSKLDDSSEFSSKSSTEMSFNDSDADLVSRISNRVMVVVDSSLEAKSALQWALSHTVQSQDTIVLLHIYKPPGSNHGSSLCPTNQKAYEILHSMKKACQMSKPGVEVEMAAVRQGGEKAAMIVEEAKQRKVSLLVLGQKRRSIMWRLQKIWKPKKKRSSNNNTKRVVDYCIQNAKCLTIAVRSKGKKRGGYLITTKRHKNFWLLA